LKPLTAIVVRVRQGTDGRQGQARTL
jgi:hypothetical protein